MQYRPGTCSECSAQYKLPSSFKADKAKCKKCGGVVNIGPAAEEAPKQDELVEHKPSGKKKSGPSMKERLLAERQAAAAGATAKPAAKAKPAARAKPTARATAKKTPVRRARASVKDGDASESKRPARAGARRGAGAGSRSSARRAGRGKDAQGEDGEEEEGRTRRGATQKKSPMPALLITVGLLIVVSLGAWWKLGSSSEAEAGNGDETVTDANDGTTPGDGAEGNGTTPEDGATPADANSNPDDGAADEGDDSEPDPVPDPVKEEPAELVMVTDPADLKRNEASGKYKIAIVKASNSEKLNARISMLYPDALYEVNDSAEAAIQDLVPFTRFEGTSAEDWAAIQENVALMLENSGRKSDMAGRSLATDYDPQHVIPAIINSMLTIDFLDREGAKNAEFCLQRLNDVVKRRFGWTYHVNEPNKAAIMNRRIVAELYSVWSRIISGEKEWSSWYMGGKAPAPDADRESTDELGG